MKSSITSIQPEVIKNRSRLSILISNTKSPVSEGEDDDSLSPDTKQNNLKKEFKKIKIQKKMKMSREVRQKLSNYSYPHLNMIFKSSEDNSRGNTIILTKRHNKPSNMKNSMESMMSEISEKTE